MTIFKIIVMDTGIQVNGRIADEKKFSFFSTFGYEKAIGFYNAPQIVFSFYKIRCNIKLHSVWW